jgi:RNA polymerase sigma-70 factor (ECF subfamily)
VKSEEGAGGLAPVRAERRDSRALPEDLERIFKEHSPLVYRAAYRLTGSVEDAEDALQTIFLRLLGQDRPPDLGLNARGYLHRAAVNVGLDILRTRKRRAAEIQAPPQTDNGEKVREAVRGALAKLTPKTAELVTLRYIEGYSNGEIASMIGTSSSVIAVTLFRARLRLKRLLRHHRPGRSTWKVENS